MITPPSLESAHHGDRPAIIAPDGHMAYGELAEAARRRACRLVDLGVAPGQVVALWGANSLEWALTAHAVGRMGAVLLPLSTRLADAEARSALTRLQPRLVVGEPEFAARAAAMGFDAADYGMLRQTAPDAPLPPSHAPDAPMALLLTSGTTGQPKAVSLSWGQAHASAMAVSEAIGLLPGDRWWLTMPLFHVGGLGGLWRCGWHGAAAVLSGRFDAAAAPGLLAREGVTIASLVPTMLRALLNAGAAFPESLRAIMLGGAAVPPDLVARCPIALATYGLTEAGSTVTLVRPGADAPSRETCGTPIPGTRLAIVDDEGRPLPAGAEGRIAVAGPTVMAEYRGDAAATLAAFNGEWLVTGDIGRLDQSGRLTVLARRHDLIVSGGENIYPAEVEGVLATHPAVAECAVVGMPDVTWGQVPVAWVALKGAASETELDAWITARLARFKRPKAYRMVAALPLLGNGKIDRQTLVADLSRV